MIHVCEECKTVYDDFDRELQCSHDYSKFTLGWFISLFRKKD